MADLSRTSWEQRQGAKHWHRGTVLTKGIIGNRYDTAVRAFQITLDTNTNQTLGLAINRAIALFGPYHHGILTLPLQRVRATRIGPKKVICHLIYARDRITPPTDRAEFTATVRTAYEAMEVEAKAASPKGVPAISEITKLPRAYGEYGEDQEPLPFWPNTPNRFDREKEPQPKIRRIAVLKIYVRTVLGFNPVGQGGDLFSILLHSNLDEVTFANRLWQPNELRFDGLEVDWEEDGAERPAFVIDYAFTARLGGWLDQTHEWNTIPEGAEDPIFEDAPPESWVILTEPRYPGVTFLNRFPVHVPR